MIVSDHLGTIPMCSQGKKWRWDHVTADKSQCAGLEAVSDLLQCSMHQTAQWMYSAALSAGVVQCTRVALLPTGEPAAS